MMGEVAGSLNGGADVSLKPPPAPGDKNYLKRYPYLFVRENDQTDYFCTLCDAYLREDELQSHLFDGHQAENISNFFVRVQAPPSAVDKGSILFQQLQRHVHICVVCWAKIPEQKDCPSHRLGCRAENGGGGGGGGADNVCDSPPQNVVSTPDIANLLNRGSSPAGSACSADDLVMNGTNGSSRSQSPRGGGSAPDVIMDQHRMRNGGLSRKSAAGHPRSSSVQQQHPCVQCSLCSMVVPSQSHCGHLRDFHRITTIDEAVAACPLCANPVPVADLGAHLIVAHGITSRSAATSVLFWVLCGLNGNINNNAFLGKLQQQQPQQPPVPPGLQKMEHVPLLPPNIIEMPKTIPPIGALTSQPPLPPHPPGGGGGGGGGISVKPPTALFDNQAAVAAAAAKLAASGLGAAQLPTVLQSLLTTTGGGVVVPAGAMADHHHHQQQQQQQQQPSNSNRLAAVENIVSRFTRCHVSPNGKESIQCLVCSKWFAVPPVKHLRGHMITFKEEKRRLVSLVNGAGHVCIICYDVFDDIVAANQHFALKHEFSMASIFPNGIPAPMANIDDIVEVGPSNPLMTPSDDLPTVIDHSVPPQLAGQARVTPAPLTPSKKKASAPPSGLKPGVELDNAGRVKSGKVRKQCELCGEWSNIKWFFKHMSEVHQALFCRCCREYLPIHEQEEHRRWHAEPPYMGQKIRIENGQPVIVDRKERASLTPIGSLAPWGGSSGGMVVKAVDTGPPTPRNPSGASAKKRKAASGLATPPADGGGGVSPDGTPPKKSSPPQQPLVGHIVDEGGSGAAAAAAGGANSKETLMPKETCPVCGILITYKNLARHIKLRHRIKYKYCHRCRQLVPNNNFEEHKATCVLAPGAPGAEPGLGGEVSLDGEAVTSEVGEEEEEGEADDDEQAIDPTEFLETNANEDSAAETAAAKGDARKSEEFRAATSKNKLHSLLGKAFKHPRRKCAICDYTVSYSNFKRHLRNAHPQHYSNQEEEEDFKKTIDSLSHAVVEDDDEAGGTGSGYVGHPMEDEDSDGEDLVIQEDDDDADAGKGDSGKFKECKVCNDHVLAEFLERHVAKNHPEEAARDEEKEESPKAEEKALEEMPVPVGKTHKNKAITDEILKD